MEFARRLGIEIAVFEPIETGDGRRVTYDVYRDLNLPQPESPVAASNFTYDPALRTNHLTTVRRAA